MSHVQYLISGPKAREAEAVIEAARRLVRRVVEEFPDRQVAEGLVLVEAIRALDGPRYRAHDRGAGYGQFQRFCVLDGQGLDAGAVCYTSSKGDANHIARIMNGLAPDPVVNVTAVT